MSFIRLSSRVAVASLLALGLSGPASAQTFYFDSFGGFITGTDFPAASGLFANDPDTKTGAGTWDVGADPDARAPGLSGPAAPTEGNLSGRSGEKKREGAGRDRSRSDRWAPRNRAGRRSRKPPRPR